MKIAILKHRTGNIRSVVNALKRIGADCIVTDMSEDIQSSDKIIIPGQGNAVETIQYLREKNLDKLIFSLSQPVLGICIGHQILCDYSEEGNIACLGVYDNMRVKRFDFPSARVKVPHMGWNTIQNLNSPFFNGIENDSFVYYVHSYYIPVNQHTIATTEYGGVIFSAAMQKNNFVSTQFHPEKSGRIGEILLDNFLKGNYD